MANRDIPLRCVDRGGVWDATDGGGFCRQEEAQMGLETASDSRGSSSSQVVVMRTMTNRGVFFFLFFFLSLFLSLFLFMVSFMVSLIFVNPRFVIVVIVVIMVKALRLCFRVGLI